MFNHLDALVTQQRATKNKSRGSGLRKLYTQCVSVCPTGGQRLHPHPLICFIRPHTLLPHTHHRHQHTQRLCPLTTTQHIYPCSIAYSYHTFYHSVGLHIKKPPSLPDTTPFHISTLILFPQNTPTNTLTHAFSHAHTEHFCILCRLPQPSLVLATKPLNISSADHLILLLHTPHLPRIPYLSSFYTYYTPFPAADHNTPHILKSFYSLLTLITLYLSLYPSSVFPSALSSFSFAPWG